jgi:hypothetical protein
LKSLEEKQQRQKKINGGKKGVSKEFVVATIIVRDCTIVEEELRLNWCKEKARGL